MKRSLIKVFVGSCAIACGGLATTLSGCSSDDAKTDGGPDGNTTPDTGMNTDTGVVDTGIMDSGTDAPAAPKLIAVHASGQLGGVRFCFGVNGSVSPLPALPHDVDGSLPLGYPAFPPGSGSPLTSTGLSITPFTITPYVFRAEKITTHTTAETAEVKCPVLVTDAGLTEGTDFYKLPDIPANTFAGGNTYLLALEGCDKNANFGGNGKELAVCGSTWNNTAGNLGLKIYQLDSTVGAKMGGQSVHASPVAMAVFQGGAVMSVLTPNPDGGAPLNNQVINTMPSQYAGAIQPTTATQVTAPIANDVLMTALLFSDGGVGSRLPLPFTAVEQLSTGKAPTGIYKTGDNFTYILIGDPSRNSNGTPFQDAGASVGAGYALHALGFSNNPVIQLCPPSCP